MKNFARNRGFTLIELLLVIGIIAILAAIVIVAINPTKQLGDARDAQRRSDVNTVLNAIWQYAIDNNGAMPCEPTDGRQSEAASDCVNTVPRMLGAQQTGCDEDAGVCSEVTGMSDDCLGLHVLSGTYLVNIPSDPRHGSGNGLQNNSKTFYVVQQSSGNRVTVTSCQPEQESSISVTR